MFISFTPPLLLQLRTERGLSQKELSRRTGLSRTTVRHAENGGNIAFSTAKRLCDALEVDFDSFFSESSSSESSSSEDFLFSDLHDFVSEHGTPEGADTLAHRMERTVDGTMKVLFRMIRLKEPKRSLCERAELSISLAILLSRFARIITHHTHGPLKDDCKYTVLLIDAISSTAKQLALDHTDNRSFHVLNGALHPLNSKPIASHGENEEI